MVYSAIVDIGEPFLISCAEYSHPQLESFSIIMQQDLKGCFSTLSLLQSSLLWCGTQYPAHVPHSLSLFLTFHLQVRSFGICTSLSGLCHLTVRDIFIQVKYH